MRPTIRGWAILIVGIAALVSADLLEVRELVFVGLVFVLLPIGTGLALLLSTPRVEVFRSFEPRVVSAGEVATVTIEVGNPGASVSSAFDAVDRLRAVRPPRRRGSLSSPGPGSTAVSKPFAVPSLAPAPRAGSRIRRWYVVSPRERGVHRVGPLRIERTDLFGLVRRADSVGEPQSLVVIPRIVPLDAGLVDSRAGSGATSSGRAARGSGSDDVIPREYRAGDAMRRVNWRATARTGDLKVRQDEQDTDPHGWMLLETRASRYLAVVEDASTASASFEWAVEMAASVIVRYVESGLEPHLVETVAIPDGHGRSTDEVEAAHDLLVRLADVRAVEPRKADDIVDGWSLAREMRDHAGAHPVVAVLAEIDVDDVAHLEALATSASSAIVFLVDPDPDPEMLDALAEAGWTCVPVDPASGHGDVWSDALSMGRRR